MKIIFPDNTYDELRSSLLSFEVETCAILLASVYEDRLVALERHVAPQLAYNHRSEVGAQLKPEFLVPLVKKAKAANQAVIFCHSHPTDNKEPQFSSIDDQGERHLANFLNRRIPRLPHGAMVVSRGGASARLLGTRAPVEIRQVGASVNTISGIRRANRDIHRWDRQIRAFGTTGQRTLRSIKVAIVGCGGTGSVIAQELAYLGVSDFLLIDPDVIEASNLNRVVGANSDDIGIAKVIVSERMVKAIHSKAKVESYQEDVRDIETAIRLIQADAIFICTDSHASRAIINQVVYQYVIPAFDAGISIIAENGRVSRITGRAQMLAPGLPCLVCGSMIDPAEVRRELQTDAERALDHYIVGHAAPQPAVISLNSTVASLNVTMFMAAFTGIPSRARLMFYDGIEGRVRPAIVRRDPTCVVCSPSGALANANNWPLPSRAHQS